MSVARGNWAIVALPPTAGTGVVVPHFWALRGFTAGSVAQETASPPPGVADISNTFFAGVIEGGLPVSRSVLGGMLFGQRSRVDAGFLKIRRKRGDQVFIDTLADYEWLNAPLYVYYAEEVEGRDYLWSDFSLRRSLRFAGEWSYTERDGTSSIALGTIDAELDRLPVQQDRFGGYGPCIQGNDEAHVEVSLAGAMHPNLYLPGYEQLLITWRWRGSEPSTAYPSIMGAGVNASTSQATGPFAGIYLDTALKRVILRYLDSAATLRYLVFADGFPAWTWDEEWHQWAVFVDWSAAEASLYLDGALVGSAQPVVVGRDADGQGYDGPAYVGKLADGGGSEFEGDLDELYVFAATGSGDDAITDDLYAVKNVPLADGTEDLLKAAYGFDDSFSFEAFDRVSAARPLIRDGVYVQANGADYLRILDDDVFDFSSTDAARIRVTFAIPWAAGAGGNGASIWVAHRSLCFSIWVDTADEIIKGRFYDQTGAAWAATISSGVVAVPGRIYTVDLTYSLPTGKTRIYVDGVLKTERDGDTYDLNDPSQDVFLGGTSTTTPDGCWVFDFGVWSSQSPNQDIKDQWYLQLTGGEGMAAYWAFSEGTGNSTDLVNETLVATLSGASWVSSNGTIKSPHPDLWGDSYEGPAALAGAWKPDANGLCVGKALVPVNAFRGIYALHWREFYSLDGLTDGGDAMSRRDDVGASGNLMTTISETAAFQIPGTWSVTASTTTVTGSGGRANSYLYQGLKIKFGGEEHCVDSVTGDNEFELVSNHTAGASSVRVYRPIPRAGNVRTDLKRGLVQVGQPAVHGYEANMKGDVCPVHGYVSTGPEIFARKVAQAVGRPMQMAVVSEVAAGIYSFFEYEDPPTAKVAQSFAWGQWVVQSPIPDEGVFQGRTGVLPHIFGRMYSVASPTWSPRWIIGMDEFGLLSAQVSDGTVNLYAGSTTGIDDGRLHLVWAVVDRTADELRLYIDDQLDDTQDISSLGSLSTSGEIGSGGVQSGAGKTYTSPGLALGPAFIINNAIPTVEEVHGVLKYRGFESGEAECYWPYTEGAGNIVDSIGSKTGVAKANSGPAAALEESYMVWARGVAADLVVDLDQVDTLAASATWPCQVWAGAEEVRLVEWLDLLATAWRGWWGAKLAGVIGLAEFDPDAASSRTLPSYEIEPHSETARTALVPTKEFSVGYGRREAVFSPGQTANFTDPDQAASVLGKLTEEWQTETADIGSTYPGAVDRAWMTAVSTRWGAKRIWKWHRALFSVLSFVVTLTQRWLATQTDELGDVVTLDGAELVTDDATTTEDCVLLQARDKPTWFQAALTFWSRNLRS